MKVKDVMRTDIITIHKDSSYEEAARILHDQKISGAPVVNDDGKLVGIISEKDLMRVLYPFYHSFQKSPEAYTEFEEREQKIKEIRKNSIEKIMSIVIISTDPETPLMKAGGLMLAKGVHRLPVLEDDKLVGLVSRKHIFTKIIQDHLGFED